jgi:hypothetical protein
VQNLAVHVVAWAAGWLPRFTLLPMSAMFPLWLWASMAIMTYLNSVSRSALSSFSPLLNTDSIQLQSLEYQFSTMPARSVILSSLLWSIVYVILAYFTSGGFYDAYGVHKSFSFLITAEGLVSYATGSVIYYHSVRQLGLVNQTVRMAARFNLFQLDPVYAFSRVTSQTGIAWMVLLTATLLLFPIVLTNALALSILVVQVVMALGAFVLPLWFVHRRLVAEKRRLLAEHNRRVESALAKLHRHLDQEELDAVKSLNDAMTALSAEQAVLTAIPTWPWRSGTLKGFVSAIVLPIVLFLIQLLARKLLGA